MRNIKLINGIEILYEKLRNWKISKLKISRLQNILDKDRLILAYFQQRLIRGRACFRDLTVFQLIKGIIFFSQYFVLSQKSVKNPKKTWWREKSRHQ